jgi:hypothetical protein
MRADLVKARLLILTVLAVLAAPTSAQAHSGGWPIHEALCVVGIGCRDTVPPGPNMDCNWDRKGVVVTVWDPILKADVEWECRCTSYISCKWFRLRIVHDLGPVPWPDRVVYDWHRACKSIVCKRIRVQHTYPRLFNAGGRL